MRFSKGLYTLLSKNKLALYYEIESDINGFFKIVELMSQLNTHFLFNNSTTNITKWLYIGSILNVYTII